MKILLFVLLLGLQNFVIAQINNFNGINLQAIARNTDGSIVPEKNITIRLSIKEGSADGKTTYQEIKRIKTNVVGVFNVVLGAQEQSTIVVQGEYDKINWFNRPTYVQLEIDLDGGINFSNLGTQELNDVPYAMVAKSILWTDVIGLDSVMMKKINIVDTAAMLAGYQRKENVVVYLKPNGSAAALTNFPILNQNTTGNANTATTANFAFKSDSATIANFAFKSDSATTANFALKSDTAKTANFAFKSDSATTANFALKSDTATTANFALKSDTATTANFATIASSAILAGNITATSNTSLTSIPNLSSVGTITSGTWSGTAISNNQLENKQISIGTTNLVLGSTTNTLTGVSSITAKEFIGALRGNATTATTADNATSSSTSILAGNITATSNSTLTALPNLASVGTISAGTWSGSIVDIGHGGTGASQLAGILLGTNGSGVNQITTAAYGSWYDNTTQVALLANTAYPMVFNTQEFAQGVSIVNNSRITVEKAGKYNIQFSAQLDRSAGTTTEYASIWLRKNGVDIPATCTDITIQGGTAVAATVAAWNFFKELNANDYLELMWSTTSSNIQIQYLNTRTNPVRPLIPSIILTVQQVY